MLVPNTKREELPSEPNLEQNQLQNQQDINFNNDDRNPNQDEMESECPMNNKLVEENNTHPNHNRKGSHIINNSGKKSISIPYSPNLLQDKHSSSSKIQNKVSNILEARVIDFRSVMNEDKKDSNENVGYHQEAFRILEINSSNSNDLLFNAAQGSQSDKICLVNEIV